MLLSQSPQSPSPDSHAGAGGQALPLPLCAVSSVQARSQSSAHSPQLPTQWTLGAQSPSPATQSCAAGQGAPSPDRGDTSCHWRAEAASHASVHVAQLPAHATSGGQSPSPATQSLTAGQAAPSPLCAATSAHTLSAAASHKAVQADQLPTQLVVAMHSPSPAAQFTAAGHAAPALDRAAVSLHARSPAASHAAVHADHEPTQSLLAGQSPSP